MDSLVRQPKMISLVTQRRLPAFAERINLNTPIFVDWLSGGGGENQTTFLCNLETNAPMPRCNITCYGNRHTACVVLYKLPSLTRGMKRPNSMLSSCFLGSPKSLQKPRSCQQPHNNGLVSPTVCNSPWYCIWVWDFFCFPVHIYSSLYYTNRSSSGNILGFTGTSLFLCLFNIHNHTSLQASCQDILVKCDQENTVGLCWQDQPDSQ